MVDMLKIASQHLSAQRRAFMAQTVLYTRGKVSVPLAATLGQSVDEVSSTDGTAIRVSSQDFIVCGAELILGGVAVTPKAGDTISYNGGVYEVCDLGNAGGVPWRWCDGQQVDLRIQTRKVK